MLADGIQKLIVRQARVREAELAEGRSLLTEQITDLHARPLGKLAHQGPVWGRLQVLDHVRLDAGVADEARVLRDVPQSGLW